MSDTSKPIERYGIGLGVTLVGVACWIVLSMALSAVGIPDDIAINVMVPVTIPFLVAGSMPQGEWYRDDRWREERTLLERIGHGVLIAVVGGVVGVPVIFVLQAVTDSIFIPLPVGMAVAFVAGLVVFFRLNGQFVDREKARSMSRFH